MTDTLYTALPDDVEHATRELLTAACELDLKLATAESCTGGLIASLLTDVTGCSHAFERGFVTYTEKAKAQLLGVSPAVLADKGAVSKEVAVAMAEGALDHSEADISVAVTGFAGPAGNGNEPGLVHFACARRGRETQHREEHFGDVGRGPVRIACMRTAVDMMRSMMH